MRSVHSVLEEQIEVRRSSGAPEQFLLRDRLYVVRAVLAHWTEPGGWRWSGPGRFAAVAGPPGAGSAPVGAAGPAGAVSVINSVPVDLADRELWRVEAAAGMSARLEVFDLCRDIAAERPRWTATLVEE
jgi:Domain of unknown function (DUF6504)